MYWACRERCRCPSRREARESKPTTSDGTCSPTRGSSMRWMMAAAWRQVTLLGLCMIAAAPVHAVEEEAHVLILNGLDPYLPAYIVIDGAMRASLANERT